MPKLTIIIVNWNNFPDTRACVQSIFAAGNHNFSLHLIVVDNGSTDDSLAQLEKEFGARLEIITSKKNLGFAGGNNLAITRALAQGADLLLLLNNDTIVAPDIFEQLFAACRAHPHVGIFGVKIYYHHEPRRLWYAGGEISRVWARTRHWHFGQFEGTQETEPQPVSFVTGCFMLVRRSVFEKIGLLDEAFFLYFEDADFCWRAAQQHDALLYLPHAVIWHKVGAGERGNYSPHYLYYQTRNRYLLLQKTGGWFYQVWLLLLHIFLYTLLRAAITAMKPGPIKWPRLHAILQGGWDGLCGRTGPRVAPL